jgi:hypothetical protein
MRILMERVKLKPSVQALLDFIQQHRTRLIFVKHVIPHAKLVLGLLYFAKNAYYY